MVFCIQIVRLFWGFFFHPKKDVLAGPLRKIDGGDEGVEVRFWIARDLDETIALLGGK